MDEWQPIETEPKDGTQILIHLRNGEITIVRSSKHAIPSDAEMRAFRKAAYEQDGTWPDAGWTPTHWMPLPPPPASP